MHQLEMENMTGMEKKPVMNRGMKHLTLFGTLLVAGASQGQNIDSSTFQVGETNQNVRLPEVVVKGLEETQKAKEGSLNVSKYTSERRDTPQTINVVPKEIMEQQNASSLREVLKNVTGISIQAGEGGVPAGDNLSIRGANARTDLFIDGVRDIGGYSRDPFNLEQVEVSKGPSSANSGRGSTGGSILLSTKTPTLQESYSGSMGLGTDEYKRLTLDINHPLEGGIPGASFRINGLWHDADVPARDEVHDTRWGVAPSLAFGLETDTRVYLGMFHLSQDNQPDYGIPWVPDNNTPLASFANSAPPVDFSNYYGLLSRDFEETDTDVFYGRLEQDFNQALSIRNHLQYGMNRRNSIITAPRFASTSTTDIRRDGKDRDQLDATLSNQTDFTLKFETGKIGHTILTGVEVTRETEDRRHLTITPGLNADLFHPNPNDPFTGTVTPASAKDESIAESVAVYAFDTVELSDQWQFSGGLRWDHFGIHFTPASASPLDRTDEMISWRTGMVYKPLPNGSVYAAYGTSFNPSAEALTLSTSATSTANFLTDPEENRSFEMGSKWDLFKGKLSVTGAIFRNEKTNARTRDPADATDVIVLEGEQRVDGFECGVSGSPWKNWNFYAGYTLLLSEVVSSKNAEEVGKDLSNTPQNTMQFWVTHHFPFHLESGLGIQFVDSRFSSNVNNRRAPEYVLLDATLAYEINESLTLRVNASNLMDESYIDRVGGGHFVPGPGRAVFVTTTFRY